MRAESHSHVIPSHLPLTLPASATDREKLGLSIWLLILLHSWTSPPDTMVKSGHTVSAHDIGEALGIGERQARRELQCLRRAGWVELRNNGRGFQIRLLRGLPAQEQR